MPSSGSAATPRGVLQELAFAVETAGIAPMSA